MGWDGKGSRSLSMERALTLGRNSATHPASLNSLNLRLFLNCRDGFKAIRKLEKKGGAYQTAATSALGRLASLILNEKLQRKNRRIPNTISYADAVALLLDPPGASKQTWDALEVVVFAIEDTTLLQQVRAKELGRIGDSASRILEMLRNLAGS